MGYYHCTNCDDNLEMNFRRNPRFCKRCKSNHHLRNMDRKQYLEWVQMKNDAKYHNELQTEKLLKKYDTELKMCNMVWSNYDHNHR